MKIIFIPLLSFFLLCGCQTSSSPSTKARSSFQVSKERYEASLKDIQRLALKLNGLIQERNFQEWKTYLDGHYLRMYNDEAKLREYSLNSPVLKQYNIRLKSFADYFEYVVVPSRSNAQVDDITFIDENRVEAWMEIKREKVLLYQLRLYGNEWKISFW